MKHTDAHHHCRGESRYLDDVPAPTGMLHAAVFASPVACGRIVSLDVGPALSAEGVFAVLTAADIPGENQIGAVIQDEELLAEGELHYVGQPVALVLAETPHQARRAAASIRLEVEELPPVLDPREAFAAGRIIGVPRTFSIGDVGEAWKECRAVAEGTCEIGGQEHAYLETQRARAIPLEGDDIRLHSSTQSPYVVQKIAARVLGVPLHRVEVDVQRLGGAFGGKEDQATAWACLAALGAWKSRRPVQLVLSRSEDMEMTGKRHPYSVDFRIGADENGRILAYEAKFYQNSGAAADLSTAILERTLFHATNAYFVPNVCVFAACCRTNLPPNTAFRGFGAPQAMFAMECAISKLATRLGMPREEIQRANLLRDGDSFPYGQRAKNAMARETWGRAEQLALYPEVRAKAEAHNRGSFVLKKGFAFMPVCFGISFTTTFLNQASALVHVYTDGSVSVSTGGIEMGQGLSSNLAQIACTAFGISSSRIKIETTNTTRIANMSPTAASSGTHLNGNAILLAVRQILDRLKALAAAKLSVRPERLSISEEKVLCDGKETEWTWQRLVECAYFSRTALSAHAFYATPDIWFDKGREKGEPFAYHVFGTAFVEVTVDCLRGTYEIDSVRIAHNLGRPMNELIDRGQIEGGVAQGLGWMTMEELPLDPKGRFLAGSLATYKTPDVHFMPDDLVVEFLQTPEASGPLGAKAVGEPPFMYGIGAYFAIRQAMNAFRPGAEFPFRSPLTPERVLLNLVE